MKLTKEQKIEVVEYALGLIESDELEFMCIALKHGLVHTVPLWDWPSTESVFRIIPEFLKYKPRGVPRHDAWFKDRDYNVNKNKRMIIFKTLLKELSV